MEKIKELVLTNLEGSKAFVYDMTGTGNHLEIYVGSDQFKGKLLLDQHRIVMDILKEELKENLHAVQIKTMSVEKFDETFKDMSL